MHIPILYESNVLIPSNQEIKLSDKDKLISRTDLEGNILFCNTTLSKLSGYKSSELLNAPHSILRHPDMPKAIFYFIWQKLLAGISTQALIKNFTKDGDFFWVMVKFTALRDNHNNVISYLSEGSQASNMLIEKINPLYEAVLDHEKRYGMYSSITYLSSILEQENVASYSDYIYKISEEKKTSFFSSLKI